MDTFALIETPDFQRAYDIHGLHYEGCEVSPEDQRFYDSYVRDLLDRRDLGLGVTLWLCYAAKYVSE